jgi:hypothetical protein
MPGTIVIKPLLANFDNDLSVELVDTVNPYCVVSMGDKKVSGPTCKKGGKYPFWKGTFLLPRGDEHYCFIEIKNNRIAPSQIIGVSEINIDEVADKGKVAQWYDVFYQKKAAGKIFIEAAFEDLVQPEQFLDYNESEGENYASKEGLSFSVEESEKIPEEPDLKTNENFPVNEELGGSQKEEVFCETDPISDQDKILLREDKLGLLEKMDLDKMDLEGENAVSNTNAEPKKESLLLSGENLFVIKEVSRDSIGDSEPNIRTPYILEERLIDEKVKDGGNESY